MPTSDQQGPTTSAPASVLSSPSADRALAPALDRTGVDHWQDRLDRARATMHLHTHDE